MPEQFGRIQPSLRRRVYLALTGGLNGSGRLSTTNRIIILLIIASIGFAVFESEELVRGMNSWVFQAAETGFAVIFALEYVARLWTCAEEPRYRGWRGRVRFILTPAALIDLLALTPLVFVAIGSEAFVLRILQLVRILRLARIGRYSNAANAIRQAIRLRRYELAASLLAGLSLMLVAAAGLYVIEGTDQPDKFGSIPRAMWWSISSLTVGYGDVYPITVMGRIFASLVAVIGVALIAVPTGIITTAFAEVLAKADAEAAALPERADFETALHDMLARADEQDRQSAEINAGELHRQIGGYPGPSHRLPLCCAVLREAMRPGDMVTHEGKDPGDAALTVRFAMPR